MGGDMAVHDPYVLRWWEFEEQETYPRPGYSWSRFFRNQEGLKGLRMQHDLAVALSRADAVILAVRHKDYLNLRPEDVIRMAARSRSSTASASSTTRKSAATSSSAAR
jgi:hypothetical protein